MRRFQSALLASLAMHGLFLFLACWFIGNSERSNFSQEQPVYVTLISTPSNISTMESLFPLNGTIPEWPFPPTGESNGEPPQVLKEPGLSDRKETSSAMKPQKPVSRKTTKPQQKLKKKERITAPDPSAPGEQGPLAQEESRNAKGGSLAGGPAEDLVHGGAALNRGGHGSTENTQQTAPVCVHRPSPGYPHAARQNGWEGTVLVAALVGDNGIVRETRIVQGSGHRILDHAAGESVKEWRFRPARRDGRNASMWVRIPVTFRLK